MFSLELPHRGDFNEYKQYTIFNIKETHPKLSQICSYGILFPRDSRTSSKTVVNEPSVFELLKVYCMFLLLYIITLYHLENTRRIEGTEYSHLRRLNLSCFIWITLFADSIMSPTKDMGTFWFQCGSHWCRRPCRRWRRRDKFLYSRYLLNQLTEFHQICLDISLGQA